MLDVVKLREIMDEKGIKTLKEVSDKTRIPYTTLNYMLAGHDMHVSTIIELARFLNVPVDDLILKSYGVAIYSDDSYKYIPCSNIYETTVLHMM